jgi:hypothetical protein
MDALVAILQDPKTGVSVILGIMWFKEWRRAERLETERAALIERVLNGLNAAAVAVTGATVSIDNMKELVSTSIANLRRDR